MARYSPAYSDWLHRLREIDTIITMARNFSHASSGPDDIFRSNVLCRSGIVLLCSHLEGYIESLGELAITRLVAKQVKKASLSPRFKYHLSQDLIDVIATINEPDDKAEKIAQFISRDLHIWDTNASFTQPLMGDNIVGRFATPNHRNIGRFFRRFGYDDFDSAMLNALQRAKYDMCINAVNNLVSERNKIAHGDHLAIGTLTDLKHIYDQTILYCRTTDILVANWFKTIGCIIR